MSKKRKHNAEWDADASVPLSKRSKFDFHFGSFNNLTVPSLKEAIKQRDPKQKITGLKKAELRAVLWELIKISPSEIEKLSKKEMLIELKMLNQARDRSKWDRTELSQYLVHLFSSVDALCGSVPSRGDQNKLNKEIPKEEFMAMPLYQLHTIYGLCRSQTDREAMYSSLQPRWKLARERNQRIESIKSHFFVETQDGLVLKQDMKENEDKVLVFENLDSGERASIHEFAEKNGLFSSSTGHETRVLGVGRKSDQSAVKQVLSERERKLTAQYRAQKQAQQEQKWNAIIATNESLKSKQGNRGEVYGGWAMNEDFGYGNERRYYLCFNESKGKVFGSFLIGPIEGKLMLETGASIDDNFDRKFAFAWRGRETGENELQIGGNQTGSMTFSDNGTVADGVLHSDFGSFRFHALRISDNAQKTASQWDFADDEEETHERERVNRWN